MRMKVRGEYSRLAPFEVFVIFFLLLSFAATAQTPSAAPASAAPSNTSSASAVPHLVRFNGTAKDLNGTPLAGVVGITFALYEEQNGGSPLWLETQNVQADSNGRYSVLLGATQSQGLPADLFMTEEARWVGVQVSRQPEQPRVLLVSAPYALKAGDAETLGGLPPSAFMLAAPASATAIAPSSAGANSAAMLPPAGADVTTTGGTVNTLPLFSTATNIQNSAITQTGSGATAKIGINNTAPLAVLDVKGSTTVRGILSLPTTGNATATAGKDSQPLTFAASAFSSSSSAAVAQTFRWQAEPAGNDTASPSGTLNLLFAAGTATPAETGLHIASNGLITFAAGQTGIFSANSNTGEVLNVTQSGAGDGVNVNAVKGFTAVNAVGNDTGVSGTANFAGGGGIGVIGSSTNGYGTYGEDLAKTGMSVGAYGVTLSPGGIGVSGEASATSGTGGIGVYGLSQGEGVIGSASGGIYAVGVEGLATGSYGFGGIFTGGPSGVVDDIVNPGGPGVSANGGNDTSSSAGGGIGGNFQGGYSSHGEGGSGVYSQAGAGNTLGGDGAIFYGGEGTGTNAPGGYGVYAIAGGGAVGYFNGAPIAGVAGFGASTGSGVLGPGVFGSDVQGGTSGTGAGFLNTDIGLWGDSGYGFAGVVASADDLLALDAANDSATLPTVSINNFSTGANAIAMEASTYSLNGWAIIGASGCGEKYMGVQLGGLGMTNCTDYTFLGDGTNTYINAGNNVGGTRTPGSILFRVNNGAALTVNTDKSVSTSGNLTVGGTLKVVGNKNFMIDHPLDPANKYLYHAAIESSEVLNLYSGNVTLDNSGAAAVQLPDWFEAVNKDFRYQLTSIGAPGRDLYIAEEVSAGRFRIAGGTPNGRVSWQVTGVRNDAWEKAHPMIVEADKGEERGQYLTPELYGAPETSRIGAGEPVRTPLPKKQDAPLKRPSAGHAVAPAVRRDQQPRLILPVSPKLPPKPRAVPAAGIKSQVAQASK